MAKALTVGDVYQLVTAEVKIVDEKALNQEVINVLLSGSSSTTCVYVINAQEKLQGIITVDDIINCVSVQIGYIPRSLNLTARKLFVLSPFGTAADMMKPPVYVTRETELQTALKKMADHDLSELPVTDQEGRVIGDLNAFEILKFI